MQLLLWLWEKEWSDSHNNEAGLPEIVIGSDNYPPYNYVDTDGNATGIDVELATEAFKRMGYKARFIYIDWEDKKNLLANRTIDCAWGSFSMDGGENEYRWARTLYDQPSGCCCGYGK